MEEGTRHNKNRNLECNNYARNGENARERNMERNKKLQNGHHGNPGNQMGK